MPTFVRHDIVDVEGRPVVGRLAVPVGVRADLADEIDAAHRDAGAVVGVATVTVAEEVARLAEALKGGLAVRAKYVF